MTHHAHRRSGFTLVEVLLSAAMLALAAAGVAAVYMSGIKSLDDGVDRAQIQSNLRSVMEELVSTPFASLPLLNTKTVMIGKSSQLMIWTALPTDINHDSLSDSDARVVTVLLAGESLQMILVDHRGRVGKL